MKHVVINWEGIFSLFYGVYHSTGVDSLGMVLTVHIWWEFNIVNSRIWAMLPNMAGDPVCNGL